MGRVFILTTLMQVEVVDVEKVLQYSFILLLFFKLLNPILTNYTKCPSTNTGALLFYSSFIILILKVL